jgi:hypothetical protein
MANAKRLTKAQITALRAAAKGGLYYRRNWIVRQPTIEALRRRGLIGNYVHGSYEITPAGRAALFGATGDLDGKEP